jgi:uncharacterized protein (DUF1800 family)
MSSFLRCLTALLLCTLVAREAVAGNESWVMDEGGSSTSPSTQNPPPTTRSSAQDREQTADQQVQHALNRLGFGPRPGDVARVRALGVDQWIARQLAPERIEDARADAIVASHEMYGRPTSEFVAMYQEGQRAVRQKTRELAQQGDSGSRRDARAELLRDDPMLRDRLRRTQRIVGDVQSVKLARAVTSERQLQEVMTDFWENHFTVFAGKGLTRLFIPSYDRDVIRPHAMGRFRDLLGGVAKSPAMLFYLDQFQSTVDSTRPALATRRRLMGPAAQQRRPRGLNENYARELLELHTLGVEGGYSQRDVIEVARALTGWTMNPRAQAEFVFRPEIHDAGEKIVLGRRLPAGRGIEDGEEVLDLLARHPSTARFVARKLAVRFVSDAPPAALIDRATKRYLDTDGDIREVVRTIVTSPEFFSRSAYRSKVKGPFELVASALRAVGADADSTMRSVQAVAFLGQPIFGHQAPNGWPETGGAWMNAGAILNRINFGLVLAAGRMPGASLSRWPEAARLRTATREEQVDAVVSAFLGGQASPDTRQILLSGENPMLARLAGSVDSNSSTNVVEPMEEASTMMPDGRPRMAARRRAGANGAFGPPVQLGGLAQVVGLAIGAPEFQRR